MEDEDECRIWSELYDAVTPNFMINKTYGDKDKMDKFNNTKIDDQLIRCDNRIFNDYIDANKKLLMQREQKIEQESIIDNGSNQRKFKTDHLRSMRSTNFDDFILEKKNDRDHDHVNQEYFKLKENYNKLKKKYTEKKKEKNQKIVKLNKEIKDFEDTNNNLLNLIQIKNSNINSFLDENNNLNKKVFQLQTLYSHTDLKLRDETTLVNKQELKIKELELKLKLSYESVIEPEETINKKCIICFENDVSYAFVPCGHLCLCEKCNNLDTCPICRDISKTMKIFY